MLEIGSLVDGKYKILNKVGQGGMSVVYLAMNEKANKQWAVKEVRKDGVLDFEAVKQGLVAETDILKRLSHPNLPSIIDVIDTDESFIIIMDYIQGNSLNKALEEYGAQPQENVIEWAKQLCDVLGYLHTRTPPIIYRDMKPANIMLKPDGNVTLIDFGTAREYKEKNLADTTCLGTVGYAAPEQFGGMGQTDARTDIYCLGATLYHLVTGMNPCEPPYEIKPIREINPNLSSGLERIIMKCTQRDPNDRYQSAAELMYALEHYEEIDDIYRKKQKKKLTLFLIPAVLAILVAAISAWGYVTAEKKLTADYDNILAEVFTIDNEAEAVQKYYDAILTDPSRTEAYIGNGELLSDDSGLVGYLIRNRDKETAEETPYLLTSEESNKLTQLNAGLDKSGTGDFKSTVKVLDELKSKNPEGYEKVCNLFGEAHLFFYDDSKKSGEQCTKAAVWFKSIQENQEEYPLARVYCNIAASITAIETKRVYEPDNVATAYEAFWDNVTELNQTVPEVEVSDYSKLRIWKLIVTLIDDNAGGLSEASKDSQKLSFEQYCETLRGIKTQIEKIPKKALTEQEIDAISNEIDQLLQSFETGKAGR